MTTTDATSNPNRTDQLLVVAPHHRTNRYAIVANTTSSPSAATLSAANPTPAGSRRPYPPELLHHRGLRRMNLLRGILDQQNPIPCPPPITQVQVLLALDVHEDDAAGQPHRHHDQLRPEGPPNEATPHLLGGPLDQHTQRPDDAQGRRTVEQHRTEEAPPLHAGHLQAAPLVERLDLGVHDERELAQLARVRLGRGKPLLQTGLVHVLEAARAVARRQQRVLGVGLAVADPADVAAALGRVAAAGTVSRMGQHTGRVPLGVLNVRRGFPVRYRHDVSDVSWLFLENKSPPTPGPDVLHRARSLSSRGRQEGIFNTPSTDDPHTSLTLL